ncbi:unnamed protein product [Parnassius mnemosyne]|uniref:Reverse transcriptase RNase H-like domain-containing protein n=1 Tax=Parnassius mnemosyne TaxID=213953 RepID=A0AAV1M3X7_9NEOP
MVQRADTIEKELLAIVWAIKTFRPYLYGRKFTIFTDYRPLAWLNSIKEFNSKLMRWKLRLAEFDYDIVYKNGKQNFVADALSRVKVNALGEDQKSMKVNVDKDEQLQRNIDSLIEEIQRLQNKDTSLMEMSSDTERTSSIPSAKSNKSKFYTITDK